MYTLIFLTLTLKGVYKDVEKVDVFRTRSCEDLSSDFLKDRLIVKFKDREYEENRDILRNTGVQILKYSEALNYFVVKLPTEDITGWLGRLSNLGGVMYVEPVYIYRATWTPNDPYFSFQWNFSKSHINMPSAWDIEKGGNSSIIVAIIDSGVAYEDFPIPSYESDEVISSDGMYHRAPDLGGTNFVNGYDFIHNDTHPNDDNGHGTHVCGTIAQTTNNGIGTAGIAFNVSIMPVKVLSHDGTGPIDLIADGIVWAADHGADVMNLSLGGPSPSSLIEDAVRYASNKGVIVVASTGNDGVGAVYYPAAYDECIAVGATDYENKRAYYSNYGAGIDIVAPGGDVTADKNGDTYADGILQQTFKVMGDEDHKATVDSFAYVFLQGTSMAAPHVTGVIALLLSHGMDKNEVREAIYNTAKDLGEPGYDLEYGYGLIQPALALEYEGNGETEEIAYDDGVPDGFYYLDVEDSNKMAVRFTPMLDFPITVDSVKVDVWDDGERTEFKLTVNPPSASNLPDLSKDICGPETFNTPGDEDYYYRYIWRIEDPPSTEKETDFFVVFHFVPPYYGPPYLAGDTLKVDGRSYAYTKTDGWGKVDVDLFIRAYITSKQGVEIIEKDKESVTRTLMVRNRSIHISPRYREGYITLYDIEGRRIKRVKIGDGGLDIKFRNSGIFYIIIESKDKREVDRVVVL